MLSARLKTQGPADKHGIGRRNFDGVVMYAFPPSNESVI